MERIKMLKGTPPAAVYCSESWALIVQTAVRIQAALFTSGHPQKLDIACPIYLWRAGFSRAGLQPRRTEPVLFGTVSLLLQNRAGSPAG